MDNTTPQQSDAASRIYFTPFIEGLRGLRETNQIETYLNKVRVLPDTLKNILKNFSTATWIEENLSAEFVISPLQRRAVARIIREVILGELYVGDMARILNQAYDIETKAAQGIAQKINFQLFTPVVDDIRLIQKEKFSQRINPATPPKIAPAQNLYQAPSSPPRTPEIQPMSPQAAPITSTPVRPAPLQYSPPIAQPQPAAPPPAPKPWATPPPRIIPMPPTQSLSSFAATEQAEAEEMPDQDVPPVNVINLRDQPKS